MTALRRLRAIFKQQSVSTGQDYFRGMRTQGKRLIGERAIFHGAVRLDIEPSAIAPQYQTAPGNCRYGIFATRDQLLLELRQMHALRHLELLGTQPITQEVMAASVRPLLKHCEIKTLSCPFMADVDSG